MRGLLRTGVVVTAAVSAAVTLYLTATLPRPAITLDGEPPPSHLSGAYHIHTTRSDGTGTVDEIAAAAARAGLTFIILTDHGDGTRTPDAPEYRHGVLVIDAVELNTRQGHLVALGLHRASPYPLAGLAVDVTDDVRRMGGVVVIAHPDSPRDELSWRGGPGADIAADGVEWINADAEWRNDPASTLITRAAQSLIRPEAAVAALFSRPVRTLQRWDTMARQRPTFGLAAVDAHANIGWRENEEPRQRTALARPSYETMFRTLVQTVIVDAGLTGDAAVDEGRVLVALTSGRTYSTVRAFAWPSALTFMADQARVEYPMGSRIPGGTGAVRLRAATATAPGARLTLLHNGRPLATGLGQVAADDVTQPGVYRVEAQLPDTTVPWIVGNPITIEPSFGSSAGPQRAPVVPALSPELMPVDVTPAAWNLEHDPASTGRVTVDGERLRVDYRLGGGVSHGQYLAAVHGADGESGVEYLRFVGQSEHPMRLSVQVRLPEGRGTQGLRWRRSIYLDASPRTFVLRLQDFEPADRPTARRPIVTPLHSVLFVVDTVNSSPDATGTFWLSDVALGVNRLDR